VKNLIVVLSSDKDMTARDVLASLQQRGERCVMLNTGDFPTRVQLDAAFSGDEWQGTIHANGETYPLEDIKSILYRRPTHYVVDATMPPQIQAFAENEAVKGFGGILRSLDCFWMSHQDAIRKAEFKPRQLKHAARLGMKTPRTLITNDPSAVQRFYRACNGKMIYKTIHGGNVQVNDLEYDAIFTSRVRADHLEKRIPLTANLFQEEIEKAFDLRITVVGTHLFAAAIHSHAEASQTDFRASYSDLTYEIFSLPPKIATFCLDLTRSFDLTYGAIDMAVTPGGEYIFFEINASGQFQWIEYFTGLPITEALVNQLIEGTVKNEWNTLTCWSIRSITNFHLPYEMRSWR
jgi:glutathione synthase/RimK-type ligase-like ATP-grasp enzyme